MIANLTGRVSAVGKAYLVVDVGGVGFQVRAPAGLLRRDQLGQTVELHTHLHVRENELALYGFGSEDELTLFELFLGVERVGPRVALALLSALSPDALRTAIVQGNEDVLARVPGIGPKTARKISFDLKDKIKAAMGEIAVSAFTDADAEVIESLTTLGYSIVEAQAALQSLPAEEMPLEEKIRLALAYFAR
jgi:Holliday junction DNA helicase RuvA